MSPLPEARAEQNYHHNPDGDAGDSDLVRVLIKFHYCDVYILGIQREVSLTRSWKT